MNHDTGEVSIKDDLRKEMDTEYHVCKTMTDSTNYEIVHFMIRKIIRMMDFFYLWTGLMILFKYLD